MAISAPPVLKTGATKFKDGSSPEERQKILLADDRCKDVEAHRVLCKICLRHVGLHSRKAYSLANWYKHIDSCYKKAEKRGEGARYLSINLGNCKFNPNSIDIFLLQCTELIGENSVDGNWLSTIAGRSSSSSNNSSSSFSHGNRRVLELEQRRAPSRSGTRRKMCHGRASSRLVWYVPAMDQASR